MAASDVSTYTAEVHFAQKLAGNEKKCRDRALKRLKKWLAVRSASKNDFERTDMIKLWKGLFYCMWMSDKPLVQEELATSISELVFDLKSSNSIFLFIETFFATMAREWYGIDRLRLDKFLMFIRRFLRTCYKWLLKNDWKEEFVDEFVSIMRKTIVYPAATADNVPFGMQSHMCDIYVVEFVEVGKDESPQEIGLKLLDLYCHLLVKSDDESLKKLIIKNVFEFVMRISNVDDDTLEDGVDKDECLEDNVELKEDEEAVTKSVSEGKKPKPKRKKHHYDKMVKIKVQEAMEVPYVQFDYGAIADRLFQLASDSEVKQRNRKMTYNLVKKFRALANGIYPLVLNLPEEVDTDLDETDIDEAIEKLDNELDDSEDELRRIKRRKIIRKRKRRH